MPATESDGASHDNVPDDIMVHEQVPAQQQQLLHSPWPQRQRAVKNLAQRSTGTHTPEEWHICAGGCSNRADAAEPAMISQQLAALMQERDSSDAAFKAEKERWAVSQETLQQHLDQAILALDAQRTTLGQISAAAAAARSLRNDGAAVLPSSSLNNQGGTTTDTAAGSGAGNTLLNDRLAARYPPDTQRSSTSMHVGGPPSRNAILTMTVESVQRVQRGTGSHSYRGRGGAMPEAVRRTSTAPGATVSASSSTWDGSHRLNMQRDTPVWQPAAPAHATYHHPPGPPPHDVDTVMAHWEGLALPAATDDSEPEDAASESRLQSRRNGFGASTNRDLKMPSLPTQSSTFPTHRGPFIVGVNGGDDSAGDGCGDWARHRTTAPLEKGPALTLPPEQVDSSDASVAGVKRSPSFLYSSSPNLNDRRDGAAPARKHVAWPSESDSESLRPVQPMAVPYPHEPLGPPVAPPLPPPPSQGLWGTTDGQQSKLKLKEAPGLVRVLFVDWDGVTKHTRRTVEEAEAHLASLSTPPSAATMIFHCFSRPPGTRGLRARVPLGAMWDAVFHAMPRLAAYRHACRVFTDTCNAKDLRRSSSPSRMHGFHESIFTAHDAHIMPALGNAQFATASPFVIDVLVNRPTKGRQARKS
ncbi:hypothetical protein JKP88DRAFT_255196 [Tribonema minus]|uniref:Uncharacterized protein n=1 Tax=Tribonema minus TaxID=303371 RepID=A0A836CH49_9STRA|nr:hypothetical protein JKP88DRAFT_255196 [Tribonema minus]